MKAKNRFCLILLIAAWDSRRARTMISLFCSGSTSASTSAIPSFDAMLRAAAQLSPVNIWRIGLRHMSGCGRHGHPLKHCQTLGGSFNLPYAETHAIELAHSVAYDQDAVPEAMQRIAHALGAKEAASGLFGLAKSIGAPTSLASLDMREEDVANPYWDPRPIEREGILKLLQNAFHGAHPGAVGASENNERLHGIARTTRNIRQAVLAAESIII